MKTTAGNDKTSKPREMRKENQREQERDGQGKELQQFTGHAIEDIKDSRLQRKKELERMTGRREETDK